MVPTPVSTDLADLAARVAQLEMLVAALSVEVVTRKLIVLDDEGQERIVACTFPHGGDAELRVHATPSHYVGLAGSHASCCPSASLAVVSDGECALMVGPAACVCQVAA
jgi:hypothetical protein